MLRDRGGVMTALFEALPVWLVDSYDEVTPRALRARRAALFASRGGGGDEFERLFAPYWNRTIHADVAAAEWAGGA